MPSPHSDLNPNPYPIQINASFLNNLFTIPWPKELRELLKIFGTLNLDFLDFDAAGAWIGRSMHYCTVTLGLCVAFMFILFGVFASHRWLLAPCVLRRDKAWAAALADSCVRVGVLCCTILYPVLAARVLKLYQLRQFNELSRLDADLRMDLDEAWPWQMGGLPFVFLLVIGLPIALFCLLCRVGRPGALAGKKPAEAAKLETRYIRRYGQLFQMYEPQCYLWEMVEVTRKLLLIAMLGFIRAGSTEQLWVGVLISLVSLLLLTYFRPYVDARVDAVAWVDADLAVLDLGLRLDKMLVRHRHARRVLGCVRASATGATAL